VEASTLGRLCPSCKTEYPPGVLRCPKDNTSTTENLVEVGSHPLAGTFVGSYRIKKLIGAGGMGEVLLGEHPTLGMSVAIKILRKEVSSDAEMVSRFFAEAKTIANLKHPNIVEILDLSVLPDGSRLLYYGALAG
jgi:serine/threonine protein kinase